MLLHVRNQTVLEPEAVADEQVARDRILIAQGGRAGLVAVVGQLPAGYRRRQTRDPGDRLEEHLRRHVASPRTQRLAEDARLDPSVAQVRSDREPVGTRSNNADRDGSLCHSVVRQLRGSVPRNHTNQEIGAV
jgi:hypothetical protein